MPNTWSSINWSNILQKYFKGCTDLVNSTKSPKRVTELAPTHQKEQQKQNTDSHQTKNDQEFQTTVPPKNIQNLQEKSRDY
jgi:hypothetical protein